MSRMYRRKSTTLFTTLGEDVVALSVERGQCYGMENVTADVWELLAEPRDLPSICSELQQRFDVSPEQCAREVGDLLEMMDEEGLLEPVEVNPESSPR